jgi:hypothetical protein
MPSPRPLCDRRAAPVAASAYALARRFGFLSGADPARWMGTNPDDLRGGVARPSGAARPPRHFVLTCSSLSPRGREKVTAADPPSTPPPGAPPRSLHPAAAFLPGRRRRQSESGVSPHRELLNDMNRVRIGPAASSSSSSSSSSQVAFYFEPPLPPPLATSPVSAPPSGGLTAAPPPPPRSGSKLAQWPTACSASPRQRRRACSLRSGVTLQKGPREPTTAGSCVMGCSSTAARLTLLQNGVLLSPLRRGGCFRTGMR